MAIGERAWCGFVVYTQKGLSVQRIYLTKFSGKVLLLS